jgi:hypothetical protein
MADERRWLVNGGGIVLITLAALCVLCVWLVRQKPEGTTAQFDESLMNAQSLRR